MTTPEEAPGQRREFAGSGRRFVEPDEEELPDDDQLGRRQRDGVGHGVELDAEGDDN